MLKIDLNAYTGSISEFDIHKPQIYLPLSVTHVHSSNLSEARVTHRGLTTEAENTRFTIAWEAVQANSAISQGSRCWQPSVSLFISFEFCRPQKYKHEYQQAISQVTHTHTHTHTHAHTHTPSHTHTHTYIYVCVCVYHFNGTL